MKQDSASDSVHLSVRHHHMQYSAAAAYHTLAQIEQMRTGSPEQSRSFLVSEPPA